MSGDRKGNGSARELPVARTTALSELLELAVEAFDAWQHAEGSGCARRCRRAIQAATAAVESLDSALERHTAAPAGHEGGPEDHKGTPDWSA